MKNILITGGCGFVGTNLFFRLDEMQFNITILDNFSSKSNYISASRNHKVINGDIRSEYDLQRALKNIDVVLHLAASGSVIDSVSNPLDNFTNNVVGTFYLLNSMRKFNIKKLVFASTGGAIIGNANPPVNENSYPFPISPYGSSKLCAEAYFSSFASSYDMDITALRFANVVGPYSYHKKGAVTSFMKLIMNNENITIFGDGSSTRDYLYVDDLGSGIISALQSKLNPGFKRYHLSSGTETSIKDLAKKIIFYSPVKYDGKIIFEEKRAGEVERNFANYDLAKSHLSFEPNFSLDEAIKITWDWFYNYKINL